MERRRGVYKIKRKEHSEKQNFSLKRELHAMQVIVKRSTIRDTVSKDMGEKSLLVDFETSRSSVILVRVVSLEFFWYKLENSKLKSKWEVRK